MNFDNLNPDDYGVRFKTTAEQKELETLRKKSKENEQHIALLKLHIIILEKELDDRKKSYPIIKHWRAADPVLPPPTESVKRILPPGPSFTQNKGE